MQADRRRSGKGLHGSLRLAIAEDKTVSRRRAAPVGPDVATERFREFPGASGRSPFFQRRGSARTRFLVLRRGVLARRFGAVFASRKTTSLNAKFASFAENRRRPTVAVATRKIFAPRPGVGKNTLGGGVKLTLREREEMVKVYLARGVAATIRRRVRRRFRPPPLFSRWSETPTPNDGRLLS